MEDGAVIITMVALVKKSVTDYNNHIPTKVCLNLFWIRGLQNFLVSYLILNHLIYIYIYIYTHTHNIFR